MYKISKNKIFAAALALTSLSTANASVSIDALLAFGNMDEAEANNIAAITNNIDELILVPAAIGGGDPNLLVNVNALNTLIGGGPDATVGVNALNALIDGGADATAGVTALHALIGGGANATAGVTAIIGDKLGPLVGVDIEAKLLNFINRLKAGVAGEVDSPTGPGENTLFNNRLPIAGINPVAGGAGGALDAFLIAMGY